MSVVPDKLRQFIFLHIKHFCHGKSVIFFKRIFLHILKIRSDSLHLLDHFYTGGESVRAVRLKRRETQIFLNIDDRIYPKSGQPFFQPPVDHLIYLFSQPRVLPVQIRLLFRKHMKIIFVCPGHSLPGASAKIRPVVAGLLSILSFHKMKIPGILAVRILQRFLKPLMLIRTVVYNQIHQDIHSPLLRLGKKFIKLLHSAEFLRNLIIIRNVIPLIHKRRPVDWRQPDNINPQIFQIIQL